MPLRYRPPLSPLPRVSMGAPVPNPFQDVVRFPVRPNGSGAREASVYDVRGRKLRDLPMPVAGGTIEWDGRDAAGWAVPAGVYFIRLRSGDVVETWRMTLVR